MKIRKFALAALVAAPLVMGCGFPQGDQYRVGTYTCLALNDDQGLDPCVYDPDPEGDPVPVEPDSNIVLHRDIIWEDDPRWDCKTMGNRICG